MLFHVVRKSLVMGPQSTRTRTNTKANENASVIARTTGVQLLLAKTVTSISLPVWTMLNMVELRLLITMRLLQKLFPAVGTQVLTFKELTGMEASLGPNSCSSDKAHNSNGRGEQKNGQSKSSNPYHGCDNAIIRSSNNSSGECSSFSEKFPRNFANSTMSSSSTIIASRNNIDEVDTTTRTTSHRTQYITIYFLRHCLCPMKKIFHKANEQIAASYVILKMFAQK